MMGANKCMFLMERVIIDSGHNGPGNPISTTGGRPDDQCSTQSLAGARQQNRSNDTYQNDFFAEHFMLLSMIGSNLQNDFYMKFTFATHYFYI
jgi:hypothetical protein